jgi:hypothetical protein
MTQKQKELLLKDLCARLPYNLVINCTEEDDEKTNFNCFLAPDMIKDIKSETAYWIIKPYLRPMSSMTNSEVVERNILFYSGPECKYQLNDWLDEHMFDYRGLIPMGLALEATEDMYKTE